MKINRGTQEEEAEEDPIEHLQRRQKKSTADQAGLRPDPKKDGTLIPHTEGLEPRVEAEPIRTELVTELSVQQAILTVQDTARPVIQESVIQLPTSPAQQEQLELERPAEAQPEPERPTEAQPDQEPQSGHQPETELHINATRQDRPLVSGNSSQPSVQTQQQGTGSQWL